MSGSLFTNILIGAALTPGFRPAIGSAISGMGEVKNSVGQVGQALAGLGAAWGTLSVLKGVKDIAADFEHSLMQAGVTADMTNSQVAALRDQIRGIAVSDKTNQSITELHSGFSALVSSGMKVDIAKAMLLPLGRAATATGANMVDLSNTAFTLNDTLGMKPEGMAAALDKLTFAGKQGAFELKDMARYIPSLPSVPTCL
jgi:hypothetical protein